MTGLLMLAFAAAGCVKDDIGLAPSVVEGRPVTVTLKCDLGRTSDITVTRAGDHSYSHLSTYTLFVYDAEGKICQQALTLESGGGLTLLGDKTGPNGEWLYQLTFKTTSGEKKLLGVANYATGNSGFWSGFTSLKNQAAAGTLSFDALRQSLISLRDGLIGADGLIMPSITASSQMLISGWNEEVVFDTDGTVTEFGTYGDKDYKIVLKMDRAMARITFKIPSVSTVNSAGHTVTFVPSTYRVYNVPKKTLLVKQSLDASGAGSYAVDYLADEEFLTSATANVPAVSGGSYTFTFYMPENVQAEVAKNADGGNMSYVDREKWTGDPGSLPQNKTWTNAPEHSTFVVIGGTYTETNGTTPIYTGNVNYTVHLGDFSDTGSLGNFSVERNYSYTYNMEVTGVENIKVEATVNGDERQPGAEGSIYDAETCVYNYLVDAHFEQGYMQYDLSAIAGAVNADFANVTPNDEEIDDAISSKLFLEVQSPFMPQASHRGSLQPYKTYADAAAGRVSMTPEEAKQNAVKDFDYKWVEFWPQNTTVISAYPGTPTWSHAYIEAYKPAGTEAIKASYLLDAYDLIVAMGKVVKKIYLNQYQGGSNTISTADYAESGITITQDQGKYVARFTAFVNEYYYYKNPLTGAALTSWGPLVNKSAREMIVAMSTDVSADGNSSYSQIHSYISQLSMQSFYNPNAGLNAFGLETYNETPLTMGFTTNVADGYLDDSDGRTNQVRLLLRSNSATSVPSDVSWNNYISMNGNGWVSTTPAERAKRKLPDAYVQKNNAAYACLSRNRDLNGNGYIDDNEVRWYLASLNEYIRIGIGSGVLSNSAQLYMGDKMAMEHDKYPDSYIGDGALYFTSSSSNKRVFWAVERGAYGGSNSSYHLPIRCIRILPTGDLTKVSGVVAASTVEKRKDKSSHLTVLKFKGRVVDELYRQRVDDALDKHNEDGDANAYYDGIYVSGSYLNDSYMLGDIIGYEGTVQTQTGTWWGNPIYTNHTFDGTMINPCYDQYGAGWRVPNLVELSAMNAVGELNNSGDNYITACCTQFSNLKVRYGFARSSLIYCPGSNSSDVGYSYNNRGIRTGFYIRCVKDVEPGYDFDTQSDPAN